MFKPIPGNHSVSISLNGEVKTNDPKECVPQIVDGKITITMYGNIVTVCVKWLALLAHFEFDLPQGQEHRLNDIKFVEIAKGVTKFHCGQIMVFRKPFVVEGKYRIVPNFPRYMTTHDGGLVIDRYKSEEVNVNRSLNGYPTAWLYCPDRSTYREVHLHRLVAYAWCRNNDPATNTVVNHKNGDKLNPHYRNLEWVTVLENHLHAIKHGLRDTVPCKVFDITTQKSHDFAALSLAEEFMGMERTLRVSDFDTLRKTYLINDQYEVRLEGDGTPWYYEGQDRPLPKGRYITTLHHRDGREEVFYDLRDVRKHYPEVVKNGVLSAKNIRNFFVNHPSIEATIEDQYNQGPYQAYCRETGKILEEDSMIELSRKTGVSKGLIRDAIVYRGEIKVYGGYAFRRATSEPWDTRFEESSSRSSKILAKHSETGEEKEFSSLREASRELGLLRPSIRLRTKNGKSLQGWFFKEIEN